MNQIARMLSSIYTIALLLLVLLATALPLFTEEWLERRPVPRVCCISSAWFRADDCRDVTNQIVSYPTGLEDADG